MPTKGSLPHAYPLPADLTSSRSSSDSPLDHVTALYGIAPEGGCGGDGNRITLRSLRCSGTRSCAARARETPVLSSTPTATTDGARAAISRDRMRRSTGALRQCTATSAAKSTSGVGQRGARRTSASAALDRGKDTAASVTGCSSRWTRITIGSTTHRPSARTRTTTRAFAAPGASTTRTPTPTYLASRTGSDYNLGTRRVPDDHVRRLFDVRRVSDTGELQQREGQKRLVHLRCLDVP